jgi:hypothetical protein
VIESSGSESSPIDWGHEALTRRTSDAQEPLHGRADCRDAEGVGSWCGDAGVVPKAWRQLADVLPLEGEYGGLEVSGAQRLRHLEEGNRKLKQLVAEQAPDVVG